MDNQSEKSQLLLPRDNEARIRIRSDPGHDKKIPPSPKKNRLLAVPSLEARVRTNSVAIFRNRDDVVSTSYGPVLSTSILSTGYGPVSTEVSSSSGSAWNACWGLSLAVLSGVLFTASNFLFQYLNLNATEVVLTRFGLQTVVLGLVLASTRTSPFPSAQCDFFLVCLQGLCAGGRVGLTFACLDFLPLGDALTIIFTEPLWTLILAKVFLGTRIGWWKGLCGLVLISGVVLCTQPPFLFSTQEGAVHAGSGYYTGVVLALFGAITGSASNVIVARCQEVHSVILVFYSGLGGFLLAVAYSFFDPNDRVNGNVKEVLVDEWIWLGLLAAMGLVGYYALTRSLQLIPPTTVAVLRAKEIVLAYMLEAAVTGHVPNSLAITGSSLVVFSVVATAVEDTLLSCTQGRVGLH